MEKYEEIKKLGKGAQGKKKYSGAKFYNVQSTFL